MGTNVVEWGLFPAHSLIMVSGISTSCKGTSFHLAPKQPKSILNEARGCFESELGPAHEVDEQQDERGDVALRELSEMSSQLRIVRVKALDGAGGGLGEDVLLRREIIALRMAACEGKGLKDPAAQH